MSGCSCEIGRKLVGEVRLVGFRHRDQCLQGLLSTGINACKGSSAQLLMLAGALQHNDQCLQGLRLGPGGEGALLQSLGGGALWATPGGSGRSEIGRDEGLGTVVTWDSPGLNVPGLTRQMQRSSGPRPPAWLLRHMPPLDSVLSPDTLLWRAGKRISASQMGPLPAPASVGGRLRSLKVSRG